MDWKFGGFILVLVGALVGIPWATSDTGLCGFELVKHVVADRTKDGAVSCLDFWANRYQTLISAVIAGSIALWAGRLLFKQVEAQRVDYLARLIREITELREVSAHLFGACSGPLHPNNKIRVSGEPDGLGLLKGMFETTLEEFWRAHEQARDLMIRLETLSLRPTAPSDTALAAHRLVWATAEFIRCCRGDGYFTTNLGMPFGLLPLNPGPMPDTLPRSDGTKRAHEAASAAWDAVLEASKAELADLLARRERAHRAAR